MRGLQFLSDWVTRQLLEMHSLPISNYRNEYHVPRSYPHTSLYWMFLGPRIHFCQMKEPFCCFPKIWSQLSNKTHCDFYMFWWKYFRTILEVSGLFLIQDSNINSKVLCFQKSHFVEAQSGGVVLAVNIETTR